MHWIKQYPGEEPQVIDSQTARQTIDTYYKPGTIEEIEAIGNPATLRLPFCVLKYDTQNLSV